MATQELSNQAPVQDERDAQVLGQGPNPTDAMGMKAQTGLPGSKSAEITNPDVLMPEEASGTPARVVHDAPQQAATSPDSGDIQADPNVPPEQGGKLPFKEQVKAYAKVHRGTLLGDKETKETGQKILAQEIPPQ